MPERALQRHGFRIPFLCGFLVALAGLGLHKYVPDVAEIEEDVGPGSPPTSPSSSAAATAATPSVGGGAPAAAAAVVAGGGSTPSSGSESRALSLSASGDGGASVAAAAPAPAAAAAGVEVGVKTPPNPLKDLMRGHKLELVLGTTVLFLYCTAFYESLVWLPVSVLCVYACVILYIYR